MRLHHHTDISDTDTSARYTRAGLVNVRQIPQTPTYQPGTDHATSSLVTDTRYKGTVPVIISPDRIFFGV